MEHPMEHCQRPWWKRPPIWFIVIAAVLTLLIVVAAEKSGTPPLTPYSTFLDQIESGNVASVTFQGMEIEGRYKRPPDSAPSSGTAKQETFRSRAPDFGDSTLIPELRKQHVVIVVNPPSQWMSLLARIPWPMLLFLGVAIIAGFFRLTRGGKLQPGSAPPIMPTHGMMGLVSSLFGKQNQPASPPSRDSDEPKSR